jgi:hypothetical protein
MSGAYGHAPSTGAELPWPVRSPSSAARAVMAASSDDLPAPASPPTISVRPRPAAASSRARSTTDSSRSRPISGSSRRGNTSYAASSRSRSANYRQNVATFFLLYAIGGAIPLAISLPLAVKHRQWRSILWMPTWFAFAFLRRLAALEAVISMPTRSFPGGLRRPASRPETKHAGSSGPSRERARAETLSLPGDQR